MLMAMLQNYQEVLASVWKAARKDRGARDTDLKTFADEIIEWLRDYGIRLDDWKHLFRDELGFALAYDESSNTLLMIAWCEPAHHLTDDICEFVEDAYEDNFDDPTVIRRDMELAGAKVTRFTPTDTGDTASDHKNSSTVDRRTIGKDAASNDATPSEFHAYSLRIGYRLVFAVATNLNELSDHAAQRKEQRERVNEFAESYLGRFITDHRAPEGDLRQRFPTSEAAVLATLPGNTLVEATIDPRPLAKWIVSEAGAADKEKPSDPFSATFFKSLALDAFGPISYRLTVDGRALHDAWFVSAPSPRRGMVLLVDQAALTPDTPDWVPANVASVAQFSFDWARAFESLRPMLLDCFGDLANVAIGRTDKMLRQVIHTDLASCISSVGRHHTLVSFARVENTHPNDDDSLLSWCGFNRTALLWQIKDENLWRKVFEFFSMADAGVLVDEQGFRGFRFDDDDVPAGLFVGRDHVVLGLGRGTHEVVLESLRTLPRANEMLKNSAYFLRIAELLPRGPCIARWFNNPADEARNEMFLFAAASMVLNGFTAEDSDEDASSNVFEDLLWSAWFSDVLAKETLKDIEVELPHLRMIRGGQATVDGHGLTIRSVAELAPQP